MKTEKVVLSIVLAAATGLALGLLFAPEKGEKVRRKIKEKGEDYLEDLKDEFTHSTERLARKIDSLYEDIATKVKG